MFRLSVVVQSVTGLIEEIKQRRQEGHAIWALNGAFQRLDAAGIEPDAQIIYTPDKKPRRICSGKLRKAMLFYASQCDPGMYSLLQSEFQNR